MTWYELLAATLICCLVVAVWLILIFDAVRTVWTDYQLGRRARRRGGDIFEAARRVRR